MNAIGDTIREKSYVLLIGTILLTFFLFTAGCIQLPGIIPDTIHENNESLHNVTYTSNETLVAFVESAATYVKIHGKEKALAEFNNPNGSFIKGELYIYAYDFNGTTLAHPVNPEKVGKNRLDEGATGIFVKEMGDIVRNGSGFYRFYYINPVHNRTLESKLGYGIKIDDAWWLGSGVYTGPVESPSP